MNMKKMAQNDYTKHNLSKVDNVVFQTFSINKYIEIKKKQTNSKIIPPTSMLSYCIYFQKE